MRHTHTRDDSERASTKAVHVVQLLSKDDSRTERLRVLLTAIKSCHCIARMYLIQLSLMSEEINATLE